MDAQLKKVSVRVAREVELAAHFKLLEQSSMPIPEKVSQLAKLFKDAETKLKAQLLECQCQLKNVKRRKKLKSKKCEKAKKSEKLRFEFCSSQKLEISSRSVHMDDFIHRQCTPKSIEVLNVKVAQF